MIEQGGYYKDYDPTEKQRKKIKDEYTNIVKRRRILRNDEEINQETENMDEIYNIMFDLEQSISKKLDPKMIEGRRYQTADGIEYVVGRPLTSRQMKTITKKLNLVNEPISYVLYPEGEESGVYITLYPVESKKTLDKLVKKKLVPDLTKAISEPIISEPIHPQTPITIETNPLMTAVPQQSTPVREQLAQSAFMTVPENLVMNRSTLSGPPSSLEKEISEGHTIPRSMIASENPSNVSIDIKAIREAQKNIERTKKIQEIEEPKPEVKAVDYAWMSTNKKQLYDDINEFLKRQGDEKYENKHKIGQELIGYLAQLRLSLTDDSDVHEIRRKFNEIKKRVETLIKPEKKEEETQEEYYRKQIENIQTVGTRIRPDTAASRPLTTYVRKTTQGNITKKETVDVKDRETAEARDYKVKFPLQFESVIPETRQETRGQMRIRGSDSDTVLGTLYLDELAKFFYEYAKRESKQEKETEEKPEEEPKFIINIPETTTTSQEEQEEQEEPVAEWFDQLEPEERGNEKEREYHDYLLTQMRNADPTKRGPFMSSEIVNEYGEWAYRGWIRMLDQRWMQQGKQIRPLEARNYELGPQDITKITAKAKTDLKVGDIIQKSESVPRIPDAQYGCIGDYSRRNMEPDVRTGFNVTLKRILQFAESEQGRRIHPIYVGTLYAKMLEVASKWIAETGEVSKAKFPDGFWEIGYYEPSKVVDAIKLFFREKDVESKIKRYNVIVNRFVEEKDTVGEGYKKKLSDRKKNKEPKRTKTKTKTKNKKTITGGAITEGDLIIIDNFIKKAKQ